MFQYQSLGYFLEENLPNVLILNISRDMYCTTSTVPLVKAPHDNAPSA